MKPDSIIVTCKACNTKNRIPAERMGDKPVCAKCRAPLDTKNTADAKPVEISDATFEKDVLSSKTPVIVDCWAPWCGPCRMLAPVLDEIASQYKGKVKIAKLNVDENTATASKYKTMSIPTLLFFKGGALADRMVGVQPKKEIESRILKMLQG
ncbi:MAG: thioredoxin [Syntrophales bacterium]|jgi:thioredoxin 2|nr:thioredoxin [Syntrophales bacterium]MDY0044409.1 thioredoxin [Syntrophales bacterium]